MYDYNHLGNVPTTVFQMSSSGAISAFEVYASHWLNPSNTFRRVASLVIILHRRLSHARIDHPSFIMALLAIEEDYRLSSPDAVGKSGDYLRDFASLPERSVCLAHIASQNTRSLIDEDTLLKHGRDWEFEDSMRDYVDDPLSSMRRLFA